jgi:hypothetical protein
MLGVDLRWDRLRWTYEFDVALRTKSASTLSGLSSEEKKKAESSFEPGAINEMVKLTVPQLRRLDFATALPRKDISLQ